MMIEEIVQQLQQQHTCTQTYLYLEIERLFLSDPDWRNSDMEKENEMKHASYSIPPSLLFFSRNPPLSTSITPTE